MAWAAVVLLLMNPSLVSNPMLPIVITSSSFGGVVGLFFQAARHLPPKGAKVRAAA